MNIRYQHQLLALAASVALLGTGCASRVATTDGPPVTHAEAREAKIQAKSEYKAEKKVIEAQKLLERADCKTESVDQIEARDCKKEAKEAARDDKREAKKAYKDEKADINARTQ